MLSAVARADPYAGALGRFYSVYIARPALARPLGRVLWRSDFAPMYASLAQLRALPAGVAVLDVACGAGVALLYNALHCLAHPEAVVQETVRCLTPGGRLLGRMLLRGVSPRVDRLMDRDRDCTVMGPGGTRGGLEAWRTQRLRSVRLDVHGAMAVFQALAPPA